MTLYLGYASPGHEASVRKALFMSFEIVSWVAMRAEFRKASDKNRNTKLFIEPLIPGTIMLSLHPEDHQKINQAKAGGHPALKHLSPTMMGVRTHRDRAELERFFEQADLDVERAKAIEETAERRKELISQYAPGQAIEMLSGPLKGMIATFVQMVESPGLPHPVIQGEIDMMGSAVKVEADILDVRRAS